MILFTSLGIGIQKIIYLSIQIIKTKSPLLKFNMKIRILIYGLNIVFKIHMEVNFIKI